MANQINRVKFSADGYLDGDAMNLTFPVRYREEHEWNQYDTAESLAKALLPVALRSGAFKNEKEVLDYIKTVFNTPHRMRKDYTKSRHNNALDEGFI